MMANQFPTKMLVIVTEIDREIERRETMGMGKLRIEKKIGSYHVCCQTDIPMCAMLLMIFCVCFVCAIDDIDTAASLIQCVKSWQCQAGTQRAHIHGRYSYNCGCV